MDEQKQFRLTAKYLLPHTPAYEKIFRQYNVKFEDVKKVEDWKERGLPLFKKTLYKRRPKDFIVQIDENEAFRIYRKLNPWLWKLLKRTLRQDIKDYFTPKMPVFSGGTEHGHPVPAFVTAHQKFKLLAQVLAKIDKHFFKEKKGRTIGMNVFPYAPHLGWHAIHQAFDKHLDINLSTAAGKAMRTSQLADIAKDMPPTHIAGMADYLRHKLLDKFNEKGVKLDNVTLINSAAKMTQKDIDQITQQAQRLGASKVRTVDVYAASELKESILPECTPGSGYHDIAGTTIIRTTKITKEQEGDYIDNWDFSQGGNVTLWTIDGAGSLFEGYMIGDYCSRIEEGCPHCDTKARRLMDINRIREVKAQLQVTGTVEAKVKGTIINLVEVRKRAREVEGVRECQVIVQQQEGADRLIIKVVPEEKAEQVRKALEGLEVTPEVKGATIEEFEDGFKFEPIKIRKAS